MVLLLAAVGLLIAALGTDRVALAWASVALSVVAAAMILRRWRRSWLQSREEPEDETVLSDDEPIIGKAEEDTDAADLLVVYELTEEVLVVDEQPRYHLPHCRWPNLERAERLPVREARELGFTPCGRCRPDKALARKHRTADATTAGS